MKEYKVITDIGRKDYMNEILNELSKDGWDLIAITNQGGYDKIYLSRDIRAKM